MTNWLVVVWVDERVTCPALQMSPAQRKALKVLARAQSAPQRQVSLARALLLAADEVANTQIAAAVGVRATLQQVASQ